MVFIPKSSLYAETDAALRAQMLATDHSNGYTGPVIEWDGNAGNTQLLDSCLLAGVTKDAILAFFKARIPKVGNYLDGTPMCASYQALIMGGDHTAAATWLRHLLHTAPTAPLPVDPQVRLLKATIADLQNAMRNRDGQIISLNSLVALWTSRAIALGYQDEGLGTPIPGTGPGGQPHD